MKKSGNIIAWCGLYAIPLHFASNLGIFKTISIICILLLFGLSLLTMQKEEGALPKEIKKWFSYIIIAILVGGFYLAISWKYTFSDIILVFIPFAILLGSYYCFQCDDDAFNIVFVPFSIISAICGIYLIINTGGFIIVELYRENVNKNQIAPFYSQLALMVLAVLLTNNKKVTRYILLTVYIACILPCLILRARTSLMALAVGSIILLYNKYKAKSFIYISIIVIALIIIGGDQLQDLLYSSLIGDNRDIHDMNSLDSGRSDRNTLAMHDILDNLLFGSASNPSLKNVVFSDYFEKPHNYLIYRTLKYGILGTFPFYGIYLIVISSAYKMYKIGRLDVLGCLIIALIESMAEYESPFGPGTSYILCYMLLGRCLRIIDTNAHHR